MRVSLSLVRSDRHAADHHFRDEVDNRRRRLRAIDFHEHVALVLRLAVSIAAIDLLRHETKAPRAMV